MSPTRVGLGAVALFAMARFVITPTWPCAFVVLGALMVAVAEYVALTMKAASESLVSERAASAEKSARAVADALQAVSERVSRLESVRSLGG